MDNNKPITVKDRQDIDEVIVLESRKINYQTLNVSLDENSVSESNSNSEELEEDEGDESTKRKWMPNQNILIRSQNKNILFKPAFKPKFTHKCPVQLKKIRFVKKKHGKFVISTVNPSIKLLKYVMFNEFYLPLLSDSFKTTKYTYNLFKYFQSAKRIVLTTQTQGSKMIVYNVEDKFSIDRDYTSNQLSYYIDWLDSLGNSIAHRISINLTRAISFMHNNHNITYQ